MKKHYLNDCDRTDLIDFLQSNRDLYEISTKNLRSLCISQLLHDFDADRYVFNDGILYDTKD